MDGTSIQVGVIVAKKGLLDFGPFNKVMMLPSVCLCSRTLQMTSSVLWTQLLNVLHVFLCAGDCTH